MFTLVSKGLKLIPAPWRYVVEVGLCVVLIATLVWAFGSVRACNYDKGRKEYQAREEQRKTERDAAIARAELAEKKAAELEPKIAAYEQLAEEKKRLDDSIAKKLDEVSKEAADEEARTNEPTDCNVRADRGCAKLHGLKPPINIDCAEYRRKLCSQ